MNTKRSKDFVIVRKHLPLRSLPSPPAFLLPLQLFPSPSLLLNPQGFVAERTEPAMVKWEKRQNCLVMGTLGPHRPRSEPTLLHFLHVGPGAGDTTALSLDLHIYKMAMSAALTSQGCYTD